MHMFRQDIVPRVGNPDVHEYVTDVIPLHTRFNYRNHRNVSRYRVLFLIRLLSFETMTIHDVLYGVNARAEASQLMDPKDDAILWAPRLGTCHSIVIVITSRSAS